MAVNVTKSLIKGFYNGSLCLPSPYCPHFQKEIGQMNRWRDEAKSYLKREPNNLATQKFLIMVYYLMYKDILNINKDNYNL